MPVIDDRGRLFGKINLIDAAVALFVLVLLPLSYSAYLLFKTPQPRVSSIKPTVFKTTKDEYIDVKGEHLRPFLRAFAGTQEVAYLFESPDHAQVKLPELKPGTYELTLFDEAQPVAKLGTFSVAPPAAPVGVTLPPSVAAVASGTFNRLDTHAARALIKGVKLASSDEADDESTERGREANEWLEVLGVLPPQPDTATVQDNVVVGGQVDGKEQVSAVVRLHCSLVGRDLKIGDTRIAVGAELPFPVPESIVSDASNAKPGEKHKRPTLLFTIGRLYPAETTPIQLQVRFVTRPDVVAVVQREQANAASIPQAFRDIVPQVLAFNVTSELLGESKLDLREGRLSIVDGKVRVPAIKTADGWTYQTRVLRAGADFTVDTNSYTVTGTILNITVP